MRRLNLPYTKVLKIQYHIICPKAIENYRGGFLLEKIMLHKYAGYLQSILPIYLWFKSKWVLVLRVKVVQDFALLIFQSADFRLLLATISASRNKLFESHLLKAISVLGL